MSHKACLIITSIAGHDNKTLQNYARLCPENGFDFIVAGDKKSPKIFKLPGCEFLDIETQKQLPFSLAKLLPDNCYSKKNIAYLQAIKQQHTVLVDTDDDNDPLDGFWAQREARLKGVLIEAEGWVNIYNYFSNERIWPRGFSLNHIKSSIPGIAQKNEEPVFCPIQQGLADGDPDIDAISRLTTPLPIYFKKRGNIVLGKQSICPFNSQNTTWFAEAFPLLYLPSYCSFRMTDIWRSFIAQRILWENNWGLAFHNSTVYQDRNVHNLLKDFEDEVVGYLRNEELMKLLCGLKLKPGEKHLGDNLVLCYEVLIENDYFDARELELVKSWISDLEMISKA